MRSLLALMIVLGVSGCAGKKLMKCPELPPADIYYCPKHVEGDYHLCVPPKDTYRCQEPQ